MNKPLWLYQRDILSPYCQEELECNAFHEIAAFPDHILSGELLIYQDNLFFDQFLIEAFLGEARKLGRAAQIAFSPQDAAIVNHALPVQEGIHLQDGVEKRFARLTKHAAEVVFEF